jgi:arylsulfatase B
MQLLNLLLPALALFTTVTGNAATSPPQPNIVYLVIDDWGWANFATHRPEGMQGNEEFLTPNLSALAAEGIEFNRMYGHKFCGPSRAAIQSGRLPIHVTVLDDNLADVNPKDPISGFQGIPRNMTGIAQKLKNANYSTHMVGKWHWLVQRKELSCCTPSLVPLFLPPPFFPYPSPPTFFP